MHLPFFINSTGKLVSIRITAMWAAIQKAKFEIMAQEDENIFKILDALDAAPINNKE